MIKLTRLPSLLLLLRVGRWCALFNVQLILWIYVLMAKFGRSNLYSGATCTPANMSFMNYLYIVVLYIVVVCALSIV